MLKFDDAALPSPSALEWETVAGGTRERTLSGRLVSDAKPVKRRLKAGWTALTDADRARVLAPALTGAAVEVEGPDGTIECLAVDVRVTGRGAFDGAWRADVAMTLEEI